MANGLWVSGHYLEMEIKGWYMQEYIYLYIHTHIYIYFYVIYIHNGSKIIKNPQNFFQLKINIDTYLQTILAVVLFSHANNNKAIPCYLMLESKMLSPSKFPGQCK